MQRLETDIDKVHRPRLDAARAEIDQLFDGAETRVDQFFEYFCEAARSVTSHAQAVSDRATQAADILSANSDRLIDEAQETTINLAGMAESLGGDLSDGAAICEASSNLTLTTTDFLATQWAVVVSEAEALRQSAERVVGEATERTAEVVNLISELDQRYAQQFVEATGSVNSALEQTQQIMQELGAADEQHGRDLIAQMDEVVTKAIGELNGFLSSIIEEFGGFREISSVLQDEGSGSMDAILSLVQDVENILDAIRPFLELIDSLS